VILTDSVRKSKKSETRRFTREKFYTLLDISKYPIIPLHRSNHRSKQRERVLARTTFPRKTPMVPSSIREKRNTTAVVALMRVRLTILQESRITLTDGDLQPLEKTPCKTFRRKVLKESYLAKIPT
jgi:hypothetical protein